MAAVLLHLGKPDWIAKTTMARHNMYRNAIQQYRQRDKATMQIAVHNTARQHGNISMLFPEWHRVGFDNSSGESRRRMVDLEWISFSGFSPDPLEFSMSGVLASHR